MGGVIVYSTVSAEQRVTIGY